jgi:hypothetical protein
MTIDDAIQALWQIKYAIGNVEVFMGNFYRDFPVEYIVIEDGYVLIGNEDIV